MRISRTGSLYTPWIWFSLAAILFVLACWLIDQTSPHIVDYGFPSFGDATVVSTEGPLDRLRTYAALALVVVIIMAVLISPGFLIHKLISKKLSRRVPTWVINFIVVPLATMLAWLLIGLILMVAGCGEHRVFIGTMKLPESLYEGDSFVARLTMKESVLRKDQFLKDLEVQQSGENVELRLMIDRGLEILALRVDLLASNVKIEGEANQTRPINQPLVYEWNLNFEKSGNLLLTFVFNAIVSDGSAISIASFDHSVRVNILGSFTGRQLSVLTSISLIGGILTTAMGLFSSFKKRTTMGW